MARFRRSFSRGRRPRPKTNWIAAANYVQTLSAGVQTDFELFDPTDTAQELSNYVSPVLRRIRGKILIDPGIGGTITSSVLAHVFAAIYVAPAALTFPSIWSSDHTIWTGAEGYSANGGIISGTDSEHHGIAFFQHQAIDVDVKVSRRLEDDRKIWLSFYNQPASGSGGVDANTSFVIRALVQE